MTTNERQQLHDLVDELYKRQDASHADLVSSVIRFQQLGTDITSELLRDRLSSFYLAEDTAKWDDGNGSL
jgi:hypothetical protein